MKKIHVILILSVVLQSLYYTAYCQVNLWQPYFASGMGLVTHYANNPDVPVLYAVDLRNPASNGAQYNNNWSLNANQVYTGTMAPGGIQQGWTREYLGQVFGVTTDQAYGGTLPYIYVTNTSCYGNGTNLTNWGAVIKIDATTGNIVKMIQLPNLGSGLGNICYDPDHYHLFVTNHHDGGIYELDLNLNILAIYYPFGPSDPTLSNNDFVALGKRLWGIAYYNNKLYFSQWNCDTRNATATGNTPNAIYSVNMDTYGGIAGASATSVFNVPFLGAGTGTNLFSNPVSDIAFDNSGNMLLAERSMINDVTPCANLSRVIIVPTGTYAGSGTSDTIYPTGSNSSTFDCLIGVQNNNVTGITGDNCSGGVSPGLPGSKLIYTTTNTILNNSTVSSSAMNISGVAMMTVPTPGNSPVASTNYYTNIHGYTTYPPANPAEYGDIFIYNPTQVCVDITNILKQYPSCGVVNLTADIAPVTTNNLAYTWSYAWSSTSGGTTSTSGATVTSSSVPTASSDNTYSITTNGSGYSFPSGINPNATVTLMISSSCCSTQQTANLSICPPPPPCTTCITSFAPIPDTLYVLSAWVKEELASMSPLPATYTGPKIYVDFYNHTQPCTSCLISTRSFNASGTIIDGWQRVEDTFRIRPACVQLNIRLSSSSSNNCLFDDIRVFPFHGSMKSYAYDPFSLKLLAELDERNYATIYEYDEEGKLTRIKKETERGVMTIQESKVNTHK